mmetsp:Transcript_75808/g.234663  ORF Transcript_75808/g.234663 Transcript_75808/m.234663 type:complete len:169 (+) Transcript_75808:77-583(+)
MLAIQVALIWCGLLFIHANAAAVVRKEESSASAHETHETDRGVGTSQFQLDFNASAKPKQACGTAKDGVKTGPNSNGWCADSDKNTHAVCASHLPANFCSETGQPGWCKPYVGGPWCICMWAYATYSEKHGCMDIKVPATDKEGICKKYKDKQGGNKDLTKAKECLKC